MPQAVPHRCPICGHRSITFAWDRASALGLGVPAERLMRDGVVEGAYLVTGDAMAVIKAWQCDECQHIEADNGYEGQDLVYGFVDS